MTAESLKSSSGIGNEPMGETRQYQSCEICGGYFIPHSSRTHICPECREKDLTRRRADIAMIKRTQTRMKEEGYQKENYHTCPNCGKEFISSARVIFCSTGCERDFLKSPPKTCLVCGKKIPANKNCCSPACEKKLAFRLACKDPRYGKCKKCGRLFLKEKASDEYCSRKCSWEFYRGKYMAI